MKILDGLQNNILICSESISVRDVILLILDFEVAEERYPCFDNEN